MVKTAVTDIVRSTVATDNPLAAFNDMVFVVEDLFASIATACLASSYDRFVEAVSDSSIVLVVKPLLEHRLHLLGAASAAECLGEESRQTLADLAVSDLHTETVLAEVLEEGVRPCRTMTLCVGGIRSRRNRTRVDRGTTRSVGYDLTVAKELADELEVWSLTATRASTRELEERSSELAVLDIRLDIYEVLFRLHVIGAVSPVLCLEHLALEWHHLEGFASLRMTRTNVHAVAAAKAVEYAHLHAEVHTLHSRRCFHLACGALDTLHLFLVHYEWADTCVRADICTLVTLDTVLSSPLRNESRYTAFLVLSCTSRPCTVLYALESRYRKEVAVLCVDWANDVGNELRFVLAIGNWRLAIVKSRPCRVNNELLVLATAVHRSVVLVDYILALLAIGLHDEVLHLLDSLLYRNNARDTEESRLEDGVGTVAKTNLASNLGSVDVVHLDIVVSEVFLHFVWQVLCEFLAFPDSIEQEGTTLLETAGYVVHLQVCLYVASHEVRSSNEVSRVDWFVTKTEV